VQTSPHLFPTEGTSRSLILFYAATILIIVAGITHAAVLATVNDDAFISFRYAQQLVNGNGLVYNPGERVEGYTNFLWTVLIAGGMLLRIDPVVWTIVLGIGFFVGTLLVACDFARRIGAGGDSILPGIPLAALALTLHRDVNVYATSGLETSMQTFFVTLLFSMLARRSDAKAFFMAGLILAAALMTRPDAAVFAGAVILFILLEKKEIIRRTMLLGAPLLVLFVPYWLVRWQYYGYFFPNAFYAKSIALPYYGQGLTYAWMYFSSYYSLLVLVPVALHDAVRRRKTNPGHPAAPVLPGGTGAGIGERSIRLGLLFIVSFTLFIVYIGGDFMFARFFIPVTPVAFILLELFIRKMSPTWLARTVALVLIVGTYFHYDYFAGQNQIGYIADEWQRYPLESLPETQKNGAILAGYFDGIPVNVAFWGGQARLMYYARPYCAIETMTGLTDTFIAHMDIRGRGRPGHEKTAPYEYLISRGTDFNFRPFPPPPPGPPPLNLIVFDSIAARIVSYRDTVMDGLRKYPGVHFRPMPEYLDAYIETMGEKQPGGVAADYAWFREFYFRHNDDPGREHAFTQYLDTVRIGTPGGKPQGY